MEVLYLLVLLLIPLLLLLFIRTGTPRRHTMWRIIRILRSFNAFDADTALSLKALGLDTEKRSGNPFIEMLFGLGLSEEVANKDAMRRLMKNDVVKTTEDGRYYLSENNLKSKRFL